MNSRHFPNRALLDGVSRAVLRFPFLILALLLPLGGGCASHYKSTSSPPSPPPQSGSHDVSPAATRPDAMDAAIDPAELLARRAEAYSKAMEPAISRRVPPQPSAVQWGDPSDLRLSTTPERIASPPERDASAPQMARALVESSSVAANEPTSASNVLRAGAASNAGAVTPPEPSVAIASAAVGGSDAPSGDALSQKLANRVRDYPRDVSGQLDYQLWQFLLDQPVPNLPALSSLPTEDRELVTTVMDGLSNFRNNLRADNNMLLSRKIKPLLELADRLRAQADLTISTLVLCKEVRGFGNYDPWEGDPPRFIAGHEHPVILYCEVQNFCAQLDDKKMWQTQLTQDAVLYTENGYAAWTDKTQAVNDVARNRRQDFFIVQKLKLPANLEIGRYLLKVSIEDKQAKRVAEATLPLLVIAQ